MCLMKAVQRKKTGITADGQGCSFDSFCKTKLEFPKKDFIAKPLNCYKRLHAAYKTKVFCLH